MNVSALLAPGHLFHQRYEVIRCLKAGGMGAVYEVVHLETRRRRALKIMLPSVVAKRDMHARFQLEARIAADIESEHIVETFDAGVDEDTGMPFLVMELLRGEDLASLLARTGALPPSSVVGALAQVASALSRTHAAGVIHRDLKPENLFVARRDDGSPKLKILDFGIAKVMSESGQAAARTRVLGTPLYMSPEQIRGDGDVDTRADLYALGHIAFTLLVGQAYWADQADQEVYALMLEIAAGHGEPATDVADRYGIELPAAFDAWFLRATASDPRARFASAPEQIEALAAALGVRAEPGSGSFAWPAEPSKAAAPSAELDTTPMTSPPFGLPTDASPTTTFSTTSPDPAKVTTSGPSFTDPSIPSLAPADAPEAAPARPRRRRVEGVAILLAGVVLVGGLAARLVGGRAATPSGEGRAPAAASSAPAVEAPAAAPSPGVSPGPSMARPLPAADADASVSSVVAASVDGTLHRETSRLVAPRPRPARPAETAAPAPSVSAELPDEIVLLRRK